MSIVWFVCIYPSFRTFMRCMIVILPSYPVCDGDGFIEQRRVDHQFVFWTIENSDEWRHVKFPRDPSRRIDIMRNFDKQSSFDRSEETAMTVVPHLPGFYLEILPHEPTHFLRS